MSVFYLRTKDGVNLIESQECETDNIPDFSTAAYVKNICTYVLEFKPFQRREELINDLEEISELRGEYFETNAHKECTTWDFLGRRYGEVAQKWDLFVVTD